MRVIVTGSRDWETVDAVWGALEEVYDQHGPFVLVHGACPTGADAAAEQWYQVAARDLKCTRIKYEADWGRYGKGAGPMRNAEMIQAGADLVLAFPLPGGTGTQNTIDLARKAGIEVRTYE